MDKAKGYIHTSPDEELYDVNTVAALRSHYMDSSDDEEEVEMENVQRIPMNAARGEEPRRGVLDMHVDSVPSSSVAHGDGAATATATTAHAYSMAAPLNHPYALAQDASARPEYTTASVNAPPMPEYNNAEVVDYNDEYDVHDRRSKFLFPESTGVQSSSALLPATSDDHEDSHGARDEGTLTPTRLAKMGFSADMQLRLGGLTIDEDADQFGFTPNELMFDLGPPHPNRISAGSENAFGFPWDDLQDSLDHA